MDEIKVKPWYKMTELGVIPEDWNIKTFNESFDFLTTASFSRDQLDNVSETKCIHYWDIHTKWNYFLDISNSITPWIKYEKAKKYPFLRDWDLIMADASEDYSWICKSVEIKNIKDNKIISWLHTFLLRWKNNIFENWFKWYIVSNKLVKNSLDRVATWLKVYWVSKWNLKNIFIPVPKSEEQKLIAQTLSDTDELINSLYELIAKKEKLKEWTMQELLTWKRRLPWFDWEWEEKRLDKTFSNITTWKLDANAMVKNWKYRFYTCAKVHYYIDNYIFNEEVLLISGNWENVWYVHYYKWKFNAYQRTYILLWFRDYIFFIKYYLDKYLKDRILIEAKLGSTPYITKDTLTDMLVKIPTDKNEQKAIAEVLSDMDNEIENLKMKRDKYKKLKEWMMQELLSWKIRLV